MFCAGCGSTLPNEAQFCPRCGKLISLDASDSAPAPSDDHPQDGPAADGGESLHRREQGEQPGAETGPETRIDADGPAAVPPSVSPPPDGTPVPVPVAAIAPVTKGIGRYVNAGSITLGVFALVCLILGAAQGFVPVFLIEGAAYFALSWICAARWPLPGVAHSAVLVVSLLVAVLVGVTLDRDTFGPRYRYLSQGAVQYRVDERAGRTDRLESGGWFPVAFDKGAQELGTVIELTNGTWSSPAFGVGKICFTAERNRYEKIMFNDKADYIIDRISMVVGTQHKSGGSTPTADSSGHISQTVVLRSEGGGFFTGEEAVDVCAQAPRGLSADETWSYTDAHAYGWIR